MGTSPLLESQIADGQTQIQAYLQVPLARNCEIVLNAIEYLSDAYLGDACPEEVAIHLRWPITAVRPRVTQLKQRGLIVRTGTVWVTYSNGRGRNVEKWRARE
jgi:hypothetical protein